MSKSFKSVQKQTILIDFNNQVYRSHHATVREKLTNTDGINVGSVIGLCKVLRFAFNKAVSDGCSLVNLVICKDSVPLRKRNLYYKYRQAFKDLEYKPDKSWDGKSDMIVSYKGNRDKSDLDYNPIEICEQFMKCIPCEIIYAENEEADDVLASYIKNHPTDNISLYSTDKDMWQLLDKYPKLKIYLNAGSDDNPDTQPNDKVIEKHFGTTDTNKIHLHKAIRGDSGDNVKSVRNFQFKRASIAYDECDGTFEDYLRKMVEHFGEDHKYTKHILKFIPIIQLNWQVVELKPDVKYNIEVIEKANIEQWNKLCWNYETPSLLNSALLKIY